MAPRTKRARPCLLHRGELNNAHCCRASKRRASSQTNGSPYPGSRLSPNCHRRAGTRFNTATPAASRFCTPRRGDRPSGSCPTGISATPRLVALAAVALAALFLLAVPSLASAAVPAHTFKEFFGSVAQPQFESERQAGIAVDQSTGDVYVIELGAQEILRYKENGEPAPFSALSGSNAIDGHSGADATPQGEILSVTAFPSEAEVAVAPSSAGATAGDIYVTDAVNGMLDIFSPSGAYLGHKAFGHPCGVAVDSAGTVFVGSSENEAALYKLEATAPGSLTELNHFSTTKPCQVAAGLGPAAGSVFVAELRGAIAKFNASTGKEDFKVIAGEAGAIASDPATGHIYVANSNELEVKEFDAAGSAPIEISSTPLAEPSHGLAVNAITGNIYTDEPETLKLEVYNPLTFSLSLSTTGQGEVKCKDQGASTFGPCAASYQRGHTVTLQADPASGSSFEGWSEFSGSGSVTHPCAGAITECEITLEGDVSGKAIFHTNPEVTLAVTRTGTGSGTLTSIPSGIDCGSVCEGKYQVGTLVTLEATPASGSVFQEWTGCTSVAGNVCHVELTADTTVGVVLAKSSHSLTIEETGNGAGSVSCNGGVCAGSYPDGTTLTLSATPNSTSTFTGWSGEGCSGSGSCTLTINGDSTVTATFGKKVEPTPTPTPVPMPAPVPIPSIKEGTAKTSTSIVQVHGNQALLKVSCTGTGACRGTLKLYAKIQRGKKVETRLIGESAFSIGSGSTKSIKIKITNAQVANRLRQGKSVTVQLKGVGIRSASVKLKPIKPGKTGGRK